MPVNLFQVTRTQKLVAGTLSNLKPEIFCFCQHLEIEKIYSVLSTRVHVKNFAIGQKWK